MVNNLTLKSFFSLLTSSYSSITLNIPIDRYNEVYINDGRYIKSRTGVSNAPIWMLYNNPVSVEYTSTEFFLDSVKNINLVSVNKQSIPTSSTPWIYISSISGTFQLNVTGTLSVSSQTTSGFKYNSSASNISMMSIASLFINTTNLSNIDSFDKFNRYLGFVLSSSGNRLGFGGNGALSENAQTANVFIEKSNYHIVATPTCELDEYSDGTYFGFDVKSKEKYFDEYNNDRPYITIINPSNTDYFKIYANGFDEEQ